MTLISFNFLTSLTNIARGVAINVQQGRFGAEVARTLPRGHNVVFARRRIRIQRLPRRRKLGINEETHSYEAMSSNEYHNAIAFVVAAKQSAGEADGHADKRRAVDSGARHVSLCCVCLSGV
jgi:hypothetical protein